MNNQHAQEDWFIDSLKNLSDRRLTPVVRRCSLLQTYFRKSFVVTIDITTKE